jgi:hypothetical protein
LPLKGAVEGLSIILQVRVSHERPINHQTFTEETWRVSDFDTELKRIEYQSARIAENPNFDLNLESTRNLLSEKATDLMTAMVKFFDSVLLYYNQSFFGMKTAERG